MNKWTWNGPNERNEWVFRAQGTVWRLKTRVNEEELDFAEIHTVYLGTEQLLQELQEVQKLEEFGKGRLLRKWGGTNGRVLRISLIFCKVF